MDCSGSTIVGVLIDIGVDSAVSTVETPEVPVCPPAATRSQLGILHRLSPEPTVFSLLSLFSLLFLVQSVQGRPLRVVFARHPFAFVAVTASVADCWNGAVADLLSQVVGTWSLHVGRFEEGAKEGDRGHDCG